ncbi:RHS repeat-associated core domain-containing protein [Pseudomonas sp. Irchel 3A7]|uniref:RHS repeat-associated core domain-containing protein n=1 Tax=Pseudomonas sp. Irchel 3A7 TaxID=2008913 RepID=UPI000BA4044B|nr:RHS repeat-associated core domain-containing protein [Pseudomonas sp. Irchel 3A7]
MPTSKPANHTSCTLLLAGDSKNTVLAEMAGSIHRLAYSPFGQQSAQQKVMTHLGFNGELREAKTDWYFLGKGYRVYNPRLMRFHSPDSMSPFGKGGLNAYGYCGGEPVLSFDPTGHIPWKLLWVTVKRQAGRTATAVLDFFSDNPSAGLNADVDLPRAQSSSGGGGLWEVGTSMAANNKNPRPPKQKLGKSRTKKKSLSKGPPPPATGTDAQPDATSAIKNNNVHTGFVLEGNYGVRAQNEYSKVKSEGGLKISGTDSGVKQIPATASGIRSPLPDKH